MNYLKTFIVAAVVGLTAVSCAEECYECTASDPNGQGTPVTEETFAQNLTGTDKTEFTASFTAQHNPAMYNITCQDK
jgi:hypothetical protein